MIHSFMHYNLSGLSAVDKVLDESGNSRLGDSSLHQNQAIMNRSHLHQVTRVSMVPIIPGVNMSLGENCALILAIIIAVIIVSLASYPKCFCVFVCIKGCSV